MKKVWSGVLAGICVLALVATPAAAQESTEAQMQAGMEAMMKAMMPGAAHQELAKAAGTYKVAFTSWMQPGAEPMEFEGQAKLAMTNGGRILEERMQASMMGMPFEGVGQSGYDNVTGQHWSTWVDNMSTSIWYAKGDENDDGTMTFRGDMTDPMAGGTKPMKIVIHPEKDGVRESYFYTTDENGKEFKMMVIKYTREKDAS